MYLGSTDNLKVRTTMNLCSSYFSLSCHFFYIKPNEQSESHSQHSAMRSHAITRLQTYHAGLGYRVREQNEEDAQHCSNLDCEAAWLALKPVGKGCGVGGSGRKMERVSK